MFFFGGGEGFKKMVFKSLTSTTLTLFYSCPVLCCFTALYIFTGLNKYNMLNSCIKLHTSSTFQPPGKTLFECTHFNGLQMHSPTNIVHKELILFLVHLNMALY